MTKAEQLKMINSLEQKLTSALEELAALKANILAPVPEGYKYSTNGKTLEDVYMAISNKKKSYACRLRIFCKNRGIDTLEQFLAVPPSEFINTKGIGVTTLHIIRKTIEGLGIVWTDVQ